METIKRNPIGISNMKNTISETKYSSYGLNSKMEMIEERVNLKIDQQKLFNLNNRKKH